MKNNMPIPVKQPISVNLDYKDINIGTWKDNFDTVLNTLRDGIETTIVSQGFVHIKFTNDFIIDLSIVDYFINLIMWYPILILEGNIKPKHIFFPENITQKEIKNYIDKFVVNPYRMKISNKEMNIVIADTLENFKYMNDFAMYLCNTICLEDDIRLMLSSEEAWECYHADVSGVSIEDVKNVGTSYTNKLINLIKDSPHCLSDFFKAGEGVNPKQFREYAVNIGTKPDGQGGVLPIVINSSYINGGLVDIAAEYADSSAGRTAEIISKKNVGLSGSFARLLGLNNIDTILHPDMNYSCNSTNFQELFISNDMILNMVKNRYYRLHPRGMEKVINYETDKFLIGQKIYLRSPMTCQSKTQGKGVCHRCYGDLAYTNKDIKVGKFAAERLSSILTQILLSAKHLLEARIKKIEWQSTFYNFFTITGNAIYLMDDLDDLNRYNILIDSTEIQSETENDNSDYNEYVTEFYVEFPNGKRELISSMDSTEMYLTVELNEMIRKKATRKEDMLCINMGLFKDEPLFLIEVLNEELSRTLKKLEHIMDLQRVTSSFTRHEILQAFLETIIEGGLSIDSVHCEVILANQIRDDENVTQNVNWEYPDESYQIVTLKQALTNNPSLIITLLYRDLKRTLYNPLTFSEDKTSPSFMDLFFMLQPQQYLDEERKLRKEGKL